MKRPLRAFFLSILLLLSSFSVQALHPALPASLHDHMTEVNKEWLHQVKPTGDFAHPASFDDDIARIQTHLYHVTDILRERTASMSLTTEQRSKRLSLLDVLGTYATSGNFPVNTRHSYRIPYFIDDWGTPCAVGHLLIESGFEAVAQRIKREINNAYVREIPYEELPAWAEAHGFLVKELAWIQPAYWPSYKWSTIGGSGANAPGNLLLEDTIHGGIIVFGEFTDFSGTPCHGVVRVQGSQITALDSFPLTGAETAVFHEGKLWVGGYFMTPMGFMGNLATWNDTAWTFSHLGAGPVHCLHVHEGALYAGGEFPSALFDNLAKYENGGWAPLGYLGPIYCMTTFQGKLIVGGDFDTRWGPGMSYVGSWDGTQWQSLATSGDTLDAPVKALAVLENELYAGGEIINKDEDRSFGFARLSDSSMGWEPLLPDYNWYFHYAGQDSMPNEITQIRVRGNTLYLSGSFLVVNGLTYGRSVALFSRYRSGFMEAIGYFDHAASDVLALGGDTVYTVGDFETPAKYATYAALTFNNLPTDPHFEELTIFPQPAQDVCILQWEKPIVGSQVQIDLYDMSGRKFRPRFQSESLKLTLFRDALPAGAYAFVLRDGEQILHRGRMIFR